MSSDTQPVNAQEISGILSRVNQLGASTEKLFSRLYRGLNRRNKQQRKEAARAELKKRIAQAKAIQQQNLSLKEKMQVKAQEIEQLYGVLNRLDEGIVMQDTEGRIVMTNAAARDLLGSMKNFWDSELGMLFDAYRDVKEIDSELAPLGEPTRVQVNNRIVGAQLAAVAGDDGQRVGTMIVLRDVTRDALADRLKDHFVTAISHELKTPMTVIKGMSEVLSSMPEDQAPNRRLLETLSRNVDILDRMVVELLDISEMGAETFSIRDDDIELAPLVGSVFNGFYDEAVKNKLEILLMQRNQNHLKVKGDGQRLRWALGHLVQNAIRYNEPAGQVIIAAGLDEDDDNFVVINVVDSGVGISDKDLPHVQDRFYRGEPRTRDGKLLDPRGLGQGLFIVRQVAEAHGGYLRVHSQQGVGSTFTLVLPVTQ